MESDQPGIRRDYTPEEREALRLPAQPAPGVGILGAALSLLRARWRAASHALLVYLGPVGVGLVVLVTLAPAPLDQDAFDAAGAGLLFMLLGGLALLTATAAGLLALLPDDTGRQRDWREAVREAPHHLGSLVLNAVAVSLAAAVVTMPLLILALAMSGQQPDTLNPVVLLLAVPAAPAWARLTAMQAVIVAEGRGPVAAISRSWNLVQGATWRVLGALVVLTVAAQAVGLLFSAVAPAGSLLSLALSMASMFAGLLAGLTLSAAVYLDGLARHEG